MSVVITVAVAALAVWLLVYGARRSDAPWWKVWLFGRGVVPSAREIRESEEQERSKS